MTISNQILALVTMEWPAARTTIRQLTPGPISGALAPGSEACRSGRLHMQGGGLSGASSPPCLRREGAEAGAGRGWSPHRLLFSNHPLTRISASMSVKEH
jgi:hypothetical protein